MDNVVEFWKMVPGGLPPGPADRSGAGQLPMRAHYCDAVTAAAGCGFYVYSPIDFRLVRDGDLVLFGFGADGEWFPLLDAVQYPGFANLFDGAAPVDMKGYSPPWLGRTETGLVQVWSGVIVRTRPDWGLWVKEPANVLRNQGIEILEGIIETDRWFGPLFSNLRLTRSDTPFYFPERRPLFQASPIPREAYGSLPFSTGDLASMTGREWDAFRRTVIERNSRHLGGYAVAARKRRASDQGE